MLQPRKNSPSVENLAYVRESRVLEGGRGLEAIVLTGGPGERLRPLTQERPKPMVEVHGKPILEYVVGWLARQGVEHLIVACSYRHEVIQDYFRNGTDWGIRITYSVEDEPLGRGGAFKKASTALDDATETFLGMNGDILTDLELGPLVQKHEASEILATLVVTPLTSPYGVVDLDGDRVIGFREKPVLPFWVNSGIYVFSRGIIPSLPDCGDHEVLTFPRLAREGLLAAYPSNAFWRTVDTAKDLADLEKALSDLHNEAVEGNWGPVQELQGG